MTHKGRPQGRRRRINKATTGREPASGPDGIVAVFFTNSEAPAASRRSQDGDLSGFQHLQQAELGGCGECSCRRRTERGGGARPPSDRQGRGCGAAEGIPGRSQRCGLARPERETGGRPSSSGLGGGGGLARVPDQPASHPCPLHSLRAGLFSRHLPEVQTAPPPATGPVLDLGFLPYPVPHPRSSPPLPPSPRVWLRWQGIRTLALNQISHFHQDFPILCQTCLGENPYIRMVSDRV